MPRSQNPGGFGAVSSAVEDLGGDTRLTSLHIAHMRTTAKWMFLAIVVGTAIAVEIRFTQGPRERMGTALRATARWSFALFWLATVGSALRTLFGTRFNKLAAHARDLGLSFASAHLVHLGLVVWMFVVSEPQFPPQTYIVFGGAVFWTYLLALLSFAPISGFLGMRAARVLRLIGVEYITVAFFVDFNKDPFGGGLRHSAYYLPFLSLTAAGPMLRIAAAVRRRTQIPMLVPTRTS